VGAGRYILTGSVMRRLMMRNLGYIMSFKKHVLLSVQNDQSVGLYTGNLKIGPGNGFTVVPGSVRSLALKATTITPAMFKQSKKRSNARGSRRKPH